MTDEFRLLIDGFADQRLAVVGDCMVDRFLWGRAERISPEAPVPVVRLERTTAKLGGAANVAHNIKALGASVVLVSITGRDDTAERLRQLLAEQGIDGDGLLEMEDRPTTVKSRIIASNQQVVRTDVEAADPLDEGQGRRLLERFADLGPFDGVVLSDYGKGVLTGAVLDGLIAEARGSGAVVAVDPKLGDFAQYRGVSSLTPNQREAELACATRITDHEDLVRVGKTLQQRCDAETLLITRGEQGMALFHRDGACDLLPTRATEVFDVTGAGDTVIAAYTTALAAGASPLAAANLANHAAGLAVREVGTAAPGADALRKALES